MDSRIATTAHAFLVLILGLGFVPSPCCIALARCAAVRGAIGTVAAFLPALVTRQSTVVLPVLSGQDAAAADVTQIRHGVRSGIAVALSAGNRS